MVSSAELILRVITLWFLILSQFFTDSMGPFNHNFLTCATPEIEDLTVCIVVNGEKFQSHAVTLTLIEQCPMSNSSELFSYTTICSSFKWIEPLFLVIVYTDRQTDGHEYSIVGLEPDGLCTLE